MFLVKPVFARYFRQFPVAISSAVMTKGYTDTLLSYQASLISRAKFSDFVIFSRSRELLYLLQVLFCSLSDYEHTIRSVEIYRFIRCDRPVPAWNPISWFQHQFWLVSTVQRNISSRQLIIIIIIIIIILSFLLAYEDVGWGVLGQLRERMV